MRDKDRLNLLKEVAGTTVYEERRNESLKIIQETKSKQDQIAVSFYVCRCISIHLNADFKTK
jgi:chromosome segregation ATPase